MRHLALAVAVLAACSAPPAVSRPAPPPPPPPDAARPIDITRMPFNPFTTATVGDWLVLRGPLTIERPGEPTYHQEATIYYKVLEVRPTEVVILQADDFGDGRFQRVNRTYSRDPGTPPTLEAFFGTPPDEKIVDISVADDVRTVGGRAFAGVAVRCIQRRSTVDGHIVSWFSRDVTPTGLVAFSVQGTEDDTTITLAVDVVGFGGAGTTTWGTRFGELLPYE